MRAAAQARTVAAAAAAARVRAARSRRITRLALLLAVVACAVPFAFPLYWLVSSSFKPESEVFLFPPTFVPSRFQWENYPEALVRFPFAQGFRNTMIIVLGVESGRLFSAPLAAVLASEIHRPPLYG